MTYPPSRSVSGFFLALLTACSSAPAAMQSQHAAAAAAPVAQVVNASHPTQCAEEDNVYVKLFGEQLTGLRIEARQPAYIASLEVDSSKANFEHCNFGNEPAPATPPPPPKRIVIWENERYQMLGNANAPFWRPANVDFVVAGSTWHELFLIQLYLKDEQPSEEGGHQFLVFYPPDGYWRAKPIPSLPLNHGVYGTSFLVGPVEEEARPIVALTKAEFVPERMSFELDYADGSHGSMQVLEVNRDKVALVYHHDRPLPQDKPLAAIRSMFVDPENADVAEVTWRARANAALSTEGLAAFARAPAAEVNFGRSVVSKHNASAPDLWFGDFRTR